jgi:hypothetical protein
LRWSIFFKMYHSAWLLSWIFIVLGHWNNSLRRDMSLHSDTLSWFWTNHSLLFLLNKYQFYRTLFWPEASTLTIMPPLRFCNNKTRLKWLYLYSWIKINNKFICDVLYKSKITKINRKKKLRKHSLQSTVVSVSSRYYHIASYCHEKAIRKIVGLFYWSIIFKPLT